MYLDFYGLSETPFNLTPDANFLFPSRVHREVLAHLLYGVNSRKGFIMVTGEVGSGKTTLCRALLKKLGPNTEVALVLNSFLSELELLKSINEDLGIATTGKSKKDLIDELNNFLLEQRMKGKNVVLVIDESQNLSFPVLEQIRMLSNLETEKEKLLQIVLMGQPELRRLIASPRLRQLSQRITVRHHITPLTKSEVTQYIYHRLKVAGSSGNIVFTQSALNEVYRFSQGIPRMINVLCDQAMLSGYVANSMRIDRKMVLAAESEMGGVGKPKRRFLGREFSPVRVGAAVGLVIALALIIAAAYYTLTGEDLFPRKEEGAGGRRVAARKKGSVPEEENKISQPPEQETQPSIGELPSLVRQAFLAGATTRVGQMLPEGLGTDMTPFFEEEQQPLSTLPPRPKAMLAEGPGPATEHSGDEVLAFRSLVEPLCVLLQTWNKSPETIKSVQERYNEVGGHLPSLAATAKMGWLSFRVDLNTLQRLDMPVIAEIVGETEEQRGFVTLIGLGETSVELATAEGTETVDRQVFARLYGGNAIIFCDDDIVNPALLRQGQSLSLEVRKLQDYMAQAGYFKGNPSGWFTPATTAAVLAFQRDEGLPASGEADGYMRLLLYALRRPANVPHLRTPS